MFLQLARCTKISSLILRGSLLLLYIPSKHACINSCPERSELAPRTDGRTALTSLARAQCGCGTAAKKVWNAVREYMHAPCIFHGVGVARISSLSDQKESWLLAGCLCLLHACSNSTQHNTSPTKDIYYSTASKLVLATQCSYNSAVVHAIKLRPRLVGPQWVN